MLINIHLCVNQQGEAGSRGMKGTLGKPGQRVSYTLSPHDFLGCYKTYLHNKIQCLKYFVIMMLKLKDCWFPTGG